MNKDKLIVVIDFRKYDGAMAGVEIVVYELCKYLGETGNSIVLCVKEGMLEEVKGIFSKLKNIKFIGLPVKSHQMSLKNIYMDSVYLQNIAEEEKADLIQFPYNWSFPFKKKVPCVLLIHDLVPFSIRDGMPYLRNKLLYKPGIKISAKLADKIITISKFSKNDIVDKTGVEAKDISVIPNGFQDFSEKVDSKELAKWKKVIGKEYILAVGGLKERKNVPRLIKAFSLFIDETGYKGKLVITNQLSGVPYYENKYNEYLAVAKKQGVDKQIVFTDFRSEGVLGGLMASANFTVYTSLFEGFGLPILESMNLGIPCITSSVTSMPEVAEDGALVVNPYSVGEIYRGMREVYQNKVLRARLIKRGKEIVKKYSWEKTGKMYVDVYRDVIKKKGL